MRFIPHQKLETIILLQMIFSIFKCFNLMIFPKKFKFKLKRKIGPLSTRPTHWLFFNPSLREVFIKKMFCLSLKNGGSPHAPLFFPCNYSFTWKTIYIHLNTETANRKVEVLSGSSPLSIMWKLKINQYRLQLAITTRF